MIKNHTGEIGTFQYDTDYYSIINDSFYGEILRCNEGNIDKKGQVIKRIPEGITMMNGMFSGLDIVFMPHIPEGVTEMNECFRECNKLMYLTKLPQSLKEGYGVFKYCKSLRKPTDIPQDIRNVDSLYKGTSLRFAVEIPETVESCEYIFDGCTHIKKFINLPKNASNSGAYRDCKVKLPPEYIPYTPEFVKTLIETTSNIPVNDIKLHYTNEDYSNMDFIRDIYSNFSIISQTSDICRTNKNIYVRFIFDWNHYSSYIYLYGEDTGNVVAFCMPQIPLRGGCASSLVTNRCITGQQMISFLMSSIGRILDPHSIFDDEMFANPYNVIVQDKCFYGAYIYHEAPHYHQWMASNYPHAFAELSGEGNRTFNKWHDSY